MPATVHPTRLRRSPLAAMLGVWARLLVAAIATLAIPAAAHALTLAEPLAAENSPLGLGRNPAPARALAELPQAPESPLESAFAYVQTAVDNAYATRGGQKLLGPVRNFAEGQLEKHFARHAGEWGAGNITKEAYLKRAGDLLGREPGGGILGATRANGDILRYNVRTNEFAVGTAEGTIRTLFRPTEGLEYWLRQVP